MVNPVTMSFGDIRHLIFIFSILVSYSKIAFFKRSQAIVIQDILRFIAKEMYNISISVSTHKIPLEAIAAENLD
jgi:hypothetical protein